MKNKENKSKKRPIIRVFNKVKFGIDFYDFIISC